MVRSCTTASLAASLLAAAQLAAPPAARAQVAASVVAGTMGAGAEVSFSFAPRWSGRLGIAGFDVSRRGEAAGGNRYDAAASLRNGRALLDWYPAPGRGGGFRLSGGLVIDDNHITGDSVPPASGVYNIGGVPVPAALLGKLHGKIDFNRAAPYLGIGWGSSPSGHGFGASLDLGAFYQGRPHVTLTPEIPAGSPLNDPVARRLLDAAIAREEGRVQSRVDSYRVYPVLAVGLSYRF
jgi:hypothetical protein